MRKFIILLSLFTMLVFIVPMEASANTRTNGIPWNVEADQIIKYANRFLGTPYEYGAKYGQTRTFDCSSFVKYVYRKYVNLPRTSRDQAKVGTKVSMKNLRKGDLVFFYPSKAKKGKISHVAIYTGNGKLLHTYGAGGVKYTPFSDYWKGRYATARRVLR